ncbi:MAG TPA: hypothetical protein VLG11_01640 [Candidatus Saccharimonadales bacterium]|nr:hypothetical protein [Candidatus Saccharimonadales bacterium]
MGRTGEKIGGALLAAGLLGGCTESVTSPPTPTFAATGCEHFAPHFAKDVDPVKAIAQAIADCYNKGPATIEKKMSWEDDSSLPAVDNIGLTVHEKDSGTVTFFAASLAAVTSPSFADKVTEVEFGIQRGPNGNKNLLTAVYYSRNGTGPEIDWTKQHPSATRFEVIKGVKESAMSVPLDMSGPKGEITYDPPTIDCAKQQAYGAFAHLMGTVPDLMSGTPDIPVPSLHANCGSADQQ